jgi:DNA replication licensing factor MCM3
MQEVDSNDLTLRDSRRAVALSSVAGTSSEAMDSTESPAAATITDDRLKIFKNGLQKAFREAREQSMSLDRITAYINKESGDEVFNLGEVNAAVAKMTDDNQIMVADGIVFLI